MKTLVFLCAAVAAAVARPGWLEAAQSPVPGARSSKAPAVITSRVPDQGGNVDDVNPAPRTFKTSGAVNPVTGCCDGCTGTRIVDNPHVGLPFGTVLPLPCPSSGPQVSPTASTAGASTTFRVDSPHVGLPARTPTPDSPATTIVSRPISSFQAGTSSDSAFGSSLYSILTEVPSKRESGGDHTIDSSPASLAVNSGAGHFSSLLKAPFVNSVFIPNNSPTHSTQVYLPVSSPISHVPSSAGAPANSVSASLPLNNDNITFLLSDPFGRLFTKTVGPKFFSRGPESILAPSNSQHKFLHSLPVKIATSNIPVNIVSFGIPSSIPNTYPFTNTAFDINNPHGIPVSTPTSDVPINNPASSLLVNSANVLLFSDNVPFGYVVNTPKGAALVGGPTNFAIFPQQPSVDDIIQVLAAHTVPAAPAATAAGSPASSQAASPSPDPSFHAGVPVSPTGSHVY